MLYAAVVVFFAVAQRKLQYFPTHQDAAGRGNATWSPWRGGDGELYGYVNAGATPKHLVVFFHGNGGEAIHRTWLGDVVGPKVAVALVEYPGYGGRPGAPTEKAIENSALAAFDALARRFPKLPIVVMGESLGTGVATYVASRRSVDRLALVSPYTDIGAVAALHYPWLPVRLLLRDRYRSLENLTDVRVPLHVVHGDRDDLIPLSEARKLFAAYGGPAKELTVLHGAGHNDMAEAILDRSEAEPFRRFLRRDRL